MYKMNIDQYRALKAQEANKASATPAPTQVATETKPVQTPVVEKPAEQTIDLEKVEVEIDGVKIPFAELKNGYLRQSDYTQKTQEVSRQKREVQDAVTMYEHLKANPELIKQVSQTTQVPPTLDPTTAKVLELENRVYDMMLEKEINTLQAKYPDFEVKDVLAVAQAEGTTNLENAYFIAKAKKPAQVVNPADLEKQIREKVIRELEAERNATQTIIGTGGNVALVSDNEPKLNEGEKRVAKMMKMTDADYAKWRDADRRKK